MFPELSAATFATRPSHPGTVTFVDADGTERRESADQIPDWLKFAPGSDGAAVPVVRIARVPGTRGFNLRSFGADGKLLWVTLMVPSNPPAVTEPSYTTPAATRPAPRRARTATPAAEATGWF